MTQKISKTAARKQEIGSAKAFPAPMIGIKKNFPCPQKFIDFKHGNIEKVFFQPPKFKTGNNFANKSEEARFLKKYDEILKL